MARNRRKIIKALYISIVVLIIMACGVGAFAYLKIKGAWDNPAGTLLADQTDSLEKNNDIVNLVLLGTDDSVARDAENMGKRTDTIVICAINIKENTVRCITIPRDTYMVLNTLNSKGQISGESANRINAAYTLGINGKKGQDYQNTLDALEQLFGNRVEFKYYASINMDGITPLANAVGGVPVTLDVDIPSIGKEGQTVTLSGEDAENYVRVRKGYSALDGSDLSRAKRQQQYFMGLAKQIKKMGALDAVPRLWSTLQSYMATNLSMEEMTAFASILNKISIEDIEFAIPMGTTGTLNGKSLFFPDDRQLQNLALDTWFTLPDGTSLWTAAPRKTPSKVLSTPETSSFVLHTSKKAATPKASPSATKKPKQTETVKPSSSPAKTSPKATKTKTQAHSPTPEGTTTKPTQAKASNE